MYHERRETTLKIFKISWNQQVLQPNNDELKNCILPSTHNIKYKKERNTFTHRKENIKTRKVHKRLVLIAYWASKFNWSYTFS